jgi:membrane-bound serine protease (ClpP class)
VNPSMGIVRNHVLVLILLLSVLPGHAETAKGHDAGAVVLTINGVIGPALSDYLTRGIRKAIEQEAALIIIELDTPGGLDTSMREIIEEIIASPVPIVGFVYPSGARAASAGTYIVYASHIAAMAPATNLGAATPVRIVGFPGGDGGKERGGEKKGDGQREQPADAMERKIINDAVAYIRGLAQMRGRNAEWAERAVREGVSLPAAEALEEHVIDVIAKDVPSLLDEIDGREVEVFGNRMILMTRNLAVRVLEPDWRSRLLAVIADPNIAYILMLVGIYGLIYEFINPGMVLPGVAGTICLLLALFAFQVLPINYAGLGLIMLGIAFMVGELFMPSFGALGIGGVIAFVIGSIMLLSPGVPGYGISLPIIALFAALTAGFFLLIVGMAVKSRRRPIVSGREEMIGAVGVALEDFQERGRVRVHSEDWNARSEVPVHRGDSVRVLAMEGLWLIVRPEKGVHRDKEI